MENLMTDRGVTVPDSSGNGYGVSREGGNNDGPTKQAFSITPSNTVNFSVPTRAIYCGGAGNIQVVTPDGTVIPFLAVPVGTILPVAAIRVNSTSTTATNLVGMV